MIDFPEIQCPPQCCSPHTECTCGDCIDCHAAEPGQEVTA